MSELETIVAGAFKARGKARLNHTEFTFALSYELHWFTQEESKKVLEEALKSGLLKEEAGKLSPAFNLRDVNVPKDFKPAMDTLNEKSLFDRILDLLGKAGISNDEARALIEKKQKDSGDLLTKEVAALVIAKEKKLNVEPYIDEAYMQLMISNKQNPA